MGPVALVGADFEENLGLGMIAAALTAAGHRVTVAPFNNPSEAPEVCRRVLAAGPAVVGLGVQFQHRAHEFLALSRRLRAAGYQGHVTAGGQWPTLAWREALDARNGLDSVVLHEGERTVVELVAALAEGRSLAQVPGLALRGTGGVPSRTAGRALEPDLDRLPFPLRYRAPTRHLGVPFLPVMGGRGCWGACTYCSITSFYRDARAYGGGRTVRWRSVENVADELAVLWRAHGPQAIFCFHDDNLLLPRPADSLARLRALRAALDARGVGAAAFIGKCRPETVTPALARALRALGVLRLYVGVENASEHGAGDLGRATQWPAIHTALEACREAGIFVCYNLLLFEPHSTLEDVRENVAFIRAHAGHPVNFCRAEPYHGTPLHLDLAERQRLSGSHLGWDYRMEDPRAELLFRVCAAAFRQRNFDPEGVGNRYMGLGYSMKLLEFFHDDPLGRREALSRRVLARTRAIALETAGLLEEAVALAARLDPSDHDGAARETALLGLRVAAADRAQHAALDALYADMSAFAASRRSAALAARVPAVGRAVGLARQVALGASLAAGGALLTGCSGATIDPVPQDSGLMDTRPDLTVADPLPPDAGLDVSARDAADVRDAADRAEVPIPVDPPPPDAGRDVLVSDPLPPDAGRDVMTDRPVVVDPPPPDAGRDAGIDRPVPVDPPPPDAALLWDPSEPEGVRRALPLLDQWRETAPRRARRSDAVALYAPPEATLAARRDGDAVEVALRGVLGPFSARWEADGAVEGEGARVRWTPADPDDQLRVAVRVQGGVAVLALRAADLERRQPSVAELAGG
ncbi:MAG: B12-binding domain-containing radical SAM protein [Deltaproteobacteria bacterium]|nr:B12-binding domain-containing radical SAM protein [Deltaproteobacteria bacterium]